MEVLRIGGHKIEITHADKMLFPKDKITKQDVILYYKGVAKRMLPYLKDRPISMVRYPNGITKEGFYQKEAGDYFPSWITTKRIKKETGGSINYVVVNNAATLVYLANQACVAIHPWLSTIDKLHYPDKIVFDLDPADVSFAAVRKAALLLKDRLKTHRLVPFVMTTGSKGLHVVVPIKRVHTFDTVRAFARRCAKELVEEYATLFTLEALKTKRKGRVYIDVIRNAFAQTSVSPYSVRPKKGAPVAMPISWNDVTQATLRPDKYTIKNAQRYLLGRKDPWVRFKWSARAFN